MVPLTINSISIENNKINDYGLDFIISFSKKNN
jgi:hypothetical protein